MVPIHDFCDGPSSVTGESGREAAVFRARTLGRLPAPPNRSRKVARPKLSDDVLLRRKNRETASSGSPTLSAGPVALDAAGSVAETFPLADAGEMF
mmetsp:Transcript_18472/g.48208  ORF Transcript_18472/g.48208 Transcript_18472/m.48208 type:complete len:96 (-) Transcript_18472:440-727(-)